MLLDAGGFTQTIVAFTKMRFCIIELFCGGNLAMGFSPFKKGMTALAVGAVCAMSLIAGGGAAQAAPAATEEGLARAACTVGTSTISECFPDPSLAGSVAWKLSLATTDVPTQAQLNGVTSLDLSSASSLEGTQFLTNLTTLQSARGTITDVSPLANLNKLTLLHLYYNQIRDVSPLAGLGGLESLELSGNPVTNLASLSGMSGLKSLYLDDSNLNDISGLAKLTQLNELSLDNNQISNLSPLADLRELTSLRINNNPVRDASMLAPSISSLGYEGALAESPEIPFTRGAVQGSVVLKSGLDSVPSNFASEYRIGSAVYTYVYLRGDGVSTAISDSSGSRYQTYNGPLSLGRSTLTARGDIVTSSVWGLDRRVVREVTPTGSIMHTVTMTNPATAPDPVTTRFYDSPDTELNGNDSIPIYSDGAGGFYIEDTAMTLYLQPVSGIDQAFGGVFGRIGTVRDHVEDGAPTQNDIAPSMGLAAGEEVIKNVDTAIYYVTPSVTLAPGDSYTYSYREALFDANEDAQIQIDYVDEASGSIIAGATQSFTDVIGAQLTLTSANLAIPAGYALASSVTLPMTVTYGAQGMLTSVQIKVSKKTSFTVSFDSLGGSAVAPADVAPGDPLTLPTDPTREGFTFVAWTTDSAGTVPFDPAAPITSNLTLYAQWIADAPGKGDETVAGETAATPPADGSLATTGGSLAAPLTLGALAAAGIALGLVLLVRRRRA